MRGERRDRGEEERESNKAPATSSAISISVPRSRASGPFPGPRSRTAGPLSAATTTARTHIL